MSKYHVELKRPLVKPLLICQKWAHSQCSLLCHVIVLSPSSSLIRIITNGPPALALVRWHGWNRGHFIDDWSFQTLFLYLLLLYHPPVLWLRGQMSVGLLLLSVSGQCSDVWSYALCFVWEWCAGGVVTMGPVHVVCNCVVFSFNLDPPETRRFISRGRGCPFINLNILSLRVVWWGWTRIQLMAVTCHHRPLCTVLRETWLKRGRACIILQFGSCCLLLPLGFSYFSCPS